MNDYVAGHLAYERHADYLREVEHDGLVAQAHRATNIAARAADHASVEHPTRSGWRSVLTHLAPSRLAARGDRP